VDYIGMAQNLEPAQAQYSKLDQDKTDLVEAEAMAVLLEEYEIVRDSTASQVSGARSRRSHPWPQGHDGQAWRGY
jgi:type I site-specific restriction-modification system R (restriction) subunit